MVALGRSVPDAVATVVGKLESLNPNSSVKDRLLPVLVEQSRRRECKYKKVFFHNIKNAAEQNRNFYAFLRADACCCRIGKSMIEGAESAGRISPGKARLQSSSSLPLC